LGRAWDGVAGSAQYCARLKERLKQSGNTLSGGEQQMLAIARCLMMRPKLIILDEPTEGIMPRLVSQIRREIHRINQTGVSILLVEQNVETAVLSENSMWLGFAS
jgi:branched-chain amino acid transport system ATP-binding protein